jgi:2-polyprenyl-6-hydroxyphenyl methylase/3-demethylubiquinone-9 3-methyltransferase
MTTSSTSSHPSSLNVDPSEIDKFSALAANWWDPESEFKPLHEINPLRLNWILEHAGSLRDKRVVDVGCGGGILTESLALSGAKVTGIDLAEKSLKVARLHGLESGVNVDYRYVSVEKLAVEEPGLYDVVTCMEMLEHVPDPGSIVRACAALVKPGGWVFFSTLNRNPKSFLFAIVGAEYVLRMLPRGTHAYENFIKPSELITATRSAGLSDIELKGLEYNPLIKHYKLSSDVSVNYLLATRREN